MDRFFCESREADGLVVVIATGELDLPFTGELQARITSTLAPSASMVVDCAGVTFCDTAGLRVLMQSALYAAQMDARFALVAVPQAVLRVLDLSDTADLFTFFEDVPAAATEWGTAREDPDSSSAIRTTRTSQAGPPEVSCPRP